MTDGLSARSVTAVVVNYRTPELTVSCVESLLRATGVDLRVIVVDNASRDDSVALFRTRFANRHDVTILARDANDGYAGGNNAGIELARTAAPRYVLVLNSDTIVAPDCVSLLVGEAESVEKTTLVVPRIMFGDAPDRLWFGGGRFSLWSGRPAHVGLGKHVAAGWSERRELPFATGCAVLVRLDALAPGAVFDSTLFSYAEDLDLSLRVRGRGGRIRYVPDAVVCHFEGTSHRRAGGQSLRFYLNTRNLLRVVGRHARWYHWVTLAPMLAIDVIGRYCAVAVRDRDPSAFAAVLRGALHAVTGGTHPIEADRTQADGP